MNIIKSKDAEEMGIKAAEYAEKLINKAIAGTGNARIVVSTGQSQFLFLNALRNKNIDWSKVEMFHLDEYIGLDEKHPASFVRYLKERFTNGLPFSRVRFIDGKANPIEEITKLNEEIKEKTVDVAFIGIGENAHIAFNDPPADFETTEPYIIVTLNETCKKQQVGEGWFKTIDDVPKTAISMSPKQIISAKSILSIVPYKLKADAVQKTLNSAVSDKNIPATLLKQHSDWTLYLDEESASFIKF